MSTLTTNQILSAARRKILEETADLVSDETLLLYANQTYTDLKIQSFTNDQIESATVALTSGVGTLPANFGTLYGPGYKSATDRTPFEEKSIADFERDPELEGMTIVGGQLKVNPNTTTSIIIRFWPTYDALTTSQNPEINNYLHELLIYGIIYRTYEDLQNESLGQYYKSYYDEELAKRLSKLSQYQEENITGGTMFNGIRII